MGWDRETDPSRAVISLAGISGGRPPLLLVSAGIDSSVRRVNTARVDAVARHVYPYSQYPVLHSMHVSRTSRRRPEQWLRHTQVAIVLGGGGRTGDYRYLAGSVRI